MKDNRNQQGFSLIELMVAIAIGGIVLTGIYASYQNQVRSSVTQQRVVDMHQNLRTAILLIERDLRMGGVNPTGDAPAGITAASANSLTIAMDNGGTSNDAINDGIDNNEDGVTDEGVDTVDNDGDGLIDEADEAEWYDGDTNDGGEVVMYDLNNGNLRRWVNPNPPPPSTNPTVATWIASNIDALDFVYFDGNDPPNALPIPVPNDQLDDIRSIEVSVVARAGATNPVMVRKYLDNTQYMNSQGTIVFDLSLAPDNFRRRMVSSIVKCRNLGL